MNFKSLALLGLSITTIGTSMMLGAAIPAFAKNIKAEHITQTDVQTPESPAVVAEPTQIPTDTNAPSEIIAPNTNNIQSDSIEPDLPSNSAANLGKCGK